MTQTTQSAQIPSNEIPTTNQNLINWVNKIAQLTKPEKIHWCDGSQEESDALAETLISDKTIVKLNSELRPDAWKNNVCSAVLNGSFGLKIKLHRS